MLNEYEIKVSTTNPLKASEELISLYNKAKVCVIKMGFEEEIKWLREVKLDNIDDKKFFFQYVHVVLNSGFKYDKAVNIRNAFFENNFDFDEIKHKQKRKAIQKAHMKHTEWLAEIKTLEDTEIIEFISGKPYMGPITKYHLAKNIGLDVAKPDRHMIRIAKKYGYIDVNEMCQALANSVNERIAVIDTILWRYCTFTIGKIILNT